MVPPGLLHFGYAFIGFSFKLIDESYGLGKKRKIISTLLSIFCGFLMGFLMVVDVFSMTIFSAVLVGSLVSRKIDNLAFVFGFFVVLFVVLFFGFFDILVFPFFLLLISAVVDELGNDYVDSHNFGVVLNLFFRYRFAMKFCVLSLFIASILPFSYFIAFLLFDIFYEFGGILSKKLI